jgi:hypothetical protein
MHRSDAVAVFADSRAPVAALFVLCPAASHPPMITSTTCLQHTSMNVLRNGFGSAWVSRSTTVVRVATARMHSSLESTESDTSDPLVKASWHSMLHASGTSA